MVCRVWATWALSSGCLWERGSSVDCVDGSPVAGGGSRRTVRIPCSGVRDARRPCRLVLAGSGACRRLAACAALRRRVGYPATKTAKRCGGVTGQSCGAAVYEGFCCLRVLPVSVSRAGPETAGERRRRIAATIGGGIRGSVARPV